MFEEEPGSRHSQSIVRKNERKGMRSWRLGAVRTFSLSKLGNHVQNNVSN